MYAGILQARELTQGFFIIVRKHQGRELGPRITAATHSSIVALARLARGLQEDLAAVTARLILNWSNRPVEG